MWTLRTGLTLVSLFAALAAATPVSTSNTTTIVKRNVCDGKGAIPKLYHSYGNDECPPPLHLNPDGTCPQPHIDQTGGQCVRFCQIKTMFTYVLIMTTLKHVLTAALGTTRKDQSRTHIAMVHSLARFRTRRQSRLQGISILM
jgi:hypothetical protein